MIGADSAIGRWRADIGALVTIRSNTAFSSVSRFALFQLLS